MTFTLTQFAIKGHSPAKFGFSEDVLGSVAGLLNISTSGLVYALPVGAGGTFDALS